MIKAPLLAHSTFYYGIVSPPNPILSVSGSVVGVPGGSKSWMVEFQRSRVWRFKVFFFWVGGGVVRGLGLRG